MILGGHVLVKNGNCYNFQTKPNEWHTLWDGWGLNMLEPVIRKSKENPEKSYIILKTDVLLKENVTPEMESEDENVVFLVPCLGEVWPKRVKLFYSPMEMNFVPSTLVPHRGEKIPKLIWRGAANQSTEWRGSAGPRGILIKLLKDAARVIEKKRVITMFPEGTRSSKGKMLPFKAGAKIVADKYKLRVQPIVLMQTAKYYNIKKFYYKPGKIKVIYMDSFIADKSNDEWLNLLRVKMQEVYDNELANNPSHR